MAFDLVDDGTLDTVLRCRGCGQESRYSEDRIDPDCEQQNGGGSICYCYNRFVAWAKVDAEEQHECPGSDIDPQNDER